MSPPNRVFPNPISDAGRHDDEPHDIDAHPAHRWSIRDVDELVEPDEAEDTAAASDGDLHVEPHGDGWWIRQQGSDTIVAEWPTQALAVSSAREIAPSTGARIVLHAADGAVTKIWRPRA